MSLIGTKAYLKAGVLPNTGWGYAPSEGPDSLLNIIIFQQLWSLKWGEKWDKQT